MAGGAFPDPIPGVIPFGTVSMFAGAPGVGKTAMISEWIVRWREGRKIWGHHTNCPTAFCYLAADRQWNSHLQWMTRAGYPEIPHYSLADDPAFDHAELMKPYNALDLFSRALDVVNAGVPPPPGAHVFVDPVSPIFIAGNPNSSRDVARTLLGMSREAQRRQINLTLVAHFAKQPTDSSARYMRPQDRIAGSGAFSGFSDTQMYLVDPEPPDHPFHMFGWNPRLSRPEEFKCTRDDKTGLFIPYDEITEDLQAGQVYDCLNEAGATQLAEIVERAENRHGYTRAIVKKALGRLIERGQVVKLKTRGVYARVKLH